MNKNLKKNKIKRLESHWRESTITYRQKIAMTVDFSEETTEARTKLNDIFKVLSEKRATNSSVYMQGNYPTDVMVK